MKLARLLRGSDCVNNKKAFTLIEMMLVIAIIVILSALFIVSLKNYLSKADSVSYSVESHQNNYAAAKSSVNALG